MGEPFTVPTWAEIDQAQRRWSKIQCSAAMAAFALHRGERVVTPTPDTNNAKACEDHSWFLELTHRYLEVLGGQDPMNDPYDVMRDGIKKMNAVLAQHGTPARKIRVSPKGYIALQTVAEQQRRHGEDLSSLICDQFCGIPIEVDFTLKGTEIEVDREDSTPPGTKNGFLT